MRKADHSPVKGDVSLCISEPELRFYLGLLTNLKADDVISESDRVTALKRLTRHLARVREVTGKQSSVSQGEDT